VTVRIQEVVVDCADPVRLATFWSALLGRPWGLVHPGWSVVEAEPLVCFQQVPEPKSSPKNRLHLDVQVDDLAAGVERALSLGASRTGGQEVGADGNGYVVLQDPEGNELCLVADTAGGWAATQRGAVASAPQRIWHLTRRTDWLAAQEAGVYRLSTFGATLDEVGFVHASRPDQLAAVAAAVLPGRPEADEELCVLVVDRVAAEASGTPVRDEASAAVDGAVPGAATAGTGPDRATAGTARGVTARAGETFPHVYGPIVPWWVVEVLPARFVDGALLVDGRSAPGAVSGRS